jgi:hypothetical protein
MRRVIATLATLISLSAVAGEIPASEGQVLSTATWGSMFVNPTTTNIDTEYRQSACPLILVCTNFKNGNLVVTDKAVLYVANGNIIKRINRSDIAQIKVDEEGWTYKGIFIYTKQYEATAFLLNNADYKAASKALEIK